MPLRTALKSLLTLALALPVIECVLISVRQMLLSMGDQDGAEFIAHLGTTSLVLWAISLVGLVIVLAIAALLESPSDDQRETD
ncbi:MAG TPA: hypothetical protein VHU84_17135 [Lacipirellulaceae bacterium]|jgi:hypothetical protein|nr:hypothetical protein [Lacipirellulaceae bacterium]